MNWNAVGDLVQLSRKTGVPPTDGYASFRYATHDLKTRGRYIAFAVACVPYTFVDEIEVFGGGPQVINPPAAGGQFRDFNEYVKQNVSVSGTQRRMSNDADAIRAAVKTAHIPTPKRDAILKRLDALVAAIGQQKPLPADFKAILPLTDTHAAILATYGDLLAAQGHNPLVAWKKHRYDWLPLLAKPATNNKADLQFSMLKNQFRSDAILLTNASTQEQKIHLKLKEAPVGAQPGWLSVNAVAWTDTQTGTPVADAFIPVQEKEGQYSIDLPAGMTRKLWFIVDSSKVPAGSTRSTLEVTGSNAPLQIPVTFTISSIAMKTPRLSLALWDYTNGNGLYGITPGNREAAISLMRSHYVDTPWASASALPLPNRLAFDEQGHLTKKLDFTIFDEWVKRWHGARQYVTFLNVQPKFASAAIDTPEFAAKVGSWAKALSNHMKELGLRPQQLGIHLKDEPKTDAHAAIIASWAKAINATAPELTLFVNPVWDRPDKIKVQEALTELDIISPNMSAYYRGGQAGQEHYEALRRKGKALWLYQCDGPARLFDPQLYHRYQAWHTYSIGGTGQGLWSFGDTGKAQSSWNEYTATYNSCTPAFLDKDTAHNSVHWEAVREGVQDYEEMAMLQDAIDASQNSALQAQARQVLQGALVPVTGAYKYESGMYDWQRETLDPKTGDEQLANVRAMLEKLRS